MNAEQTKILHKSQILLKVLSEQDSYNCVKSIVKKPKIDSAIAKLNNFISLIEPETEIDEKEVSKIRITFDNFKDYLNLNIIARQFQLNIERFEPIIESMTEKYKISGDNMDEINDMYTKLTSCVEDLVENPERRANINECSTALFGLLSKIDQTWEMSNQRANLWSKTNLTLRKSTEKLIMDISTVSGVVDVIDDFISSLQNKDDLESAFSEFFQPKRLNYIKPLQEIPMELATNIEKDAMRAREKEVQNAYRSLSVTFSPLKDLVTEQEENKLLKALYRASLMSKEDFEALKQENENLKEAIKELEDLVAAQKTAESTPKKSRSRKK